VLERRVVTLHEKPCPHRAASGEESWKQS
jgi:hypothetical protein